MSAPVRPPHAGACTGSGSRGSPRPRRSAEARRASPEADAKPMLDQLVADGLAAYRDGKLSGFSLTKPGREEHARLLSAELDAPGARDAVEAAYRPLPAAQHRAARRLHRVAAPRRRRRVHRERPQRRRLRRRGHRASWPRCTPGSSRSAPTSAPPSTASAATARASPRALERVQAGDARLVHEADDRQLPHGVVRAARGPPLHARHRARRRRRG